MARLTVSAATLALGTRQLAVMVRAGIPLLRALTVLSRQPEDLRWGRVVLSVRGSVAQGQPLSESLAAFPAVFSPVYLALAREGESTGNLAVSLDKAASFLEDDLRLRRRLQAALTYPLFVLATGVGTGYLCLRLMQPYLAELFSDSEGVRLPLATRSLLAFASAAARPEVGLAVLALAGLTLWSTRSRWATPQGRLARDRGLLRLPVVGPLLRQVVLCRLARSLAASLRAGLRVSEALLLGAEGTGNEVYRRDLRAAWDSLFRGETLDSHLRTRPELYPAPLPHFVAVGLESGTLPKMVSRFADLAEISAEGRLNTLVELLSPSLLALMGLMVGWIALSIFPALYALLGDLA